MGENALEFLCELLNKYIVYALIGLSEQDIHMYAMDAGAVWIEQALFVLLLLAQGNLYLQFV